MGIVINLENKNANAKIKIKLTKRMNIKLTLRRGEKKLMPTKGININIEKIIKSFFIREFFIFLISNIYIFYHILKQNKKTFIKNPLKKHDLIHSSLKKFVFIIF